MKLKIKITKEVLEATKMCGTKDFMLKDSIGYSQSGNCAVTYACRKLFLNCYTSDKIYICDEYGQVTKIASLPQIAMDFVWLFDRVTSEKRVKMKPFEFEIELTKEALDLITIDEITKVLETSTTLEIV